MKKILCTALALTMCLSMAALTGCTPRENTLKIYNWGEYMDPEVYKGFEEWYKAETGKEVKVKYQEFDTNEKMLTRISVEKDDYDLVCPSDYMAQRMIEEGLVQPVKADIFDIKQDDLFYGNLMELVREFDPDNQYFVPYVWGTFGIMYDTSKVTEAQAAEMNSWAALWSDTFKKEILMKDSVRDAYTVALLYSRREALSAASNGFTDFGETYRTELDKIFATATDATIEEAKAVLLAQKSVITKYEVDDGKDDMLTGNTDAKLGLFWSCDAGYVMNDVETEAKGCVKAQLVEGNKDLAYVVPKEGSNVWVDGWLIPTTAKNTDAANWFLKYISSAEVAKQNMDWMGTSVAVKSAMEAAKAELESDEEFFAGTREGFKQMYLDMMFPPEDVLARCGLMGDFGSDINDKLSGMWEDVRSK